MNHSLCRAAVVALAAACGLAAGCGQSPKLVAVRGTLTKGAQPLPDVMIQLAPDQEGTEAKAAYGHTDAAGAFVMKTLPHGDGVVPGRYRVALVPEDGKPSRKLVPGKFQDVGQTPWRVTVPAAGLDSLKLDLTKDEVAGASAG